MRPIKKTCYIQKELEKIRKRDEMNEILKEELKLSRPQNN